MNGQFDDGGRGFVSWKWRECSVLACSLVAGLSVLGASERTGCAGLGWAAMGGGDVLVIIMVRGRALIGMCAGTVIVVVMAIVIVVVLLLYDIIGMGGVMMGMVMVVVTVLIITKIIIAMVIIIVTVIIYRHPIP